MASIDIILALPRTLMSVILSDWLPYHGMRQLTEAYSISKSLRTQFLLVLLVPYHLGSEMTKTPFQVRMERDQDHLQEFTRSLTFHIEWMKKIIAEYEPGP